jgi:hypothetical protein
MSGKERAIMTTPSTPRALILAAAAVASLIFAVSPAAAAAGQGARMPAGARATVAPIMQGPSKIVRDHRRNPQCRWTGHFRCIPKDPSSWGR